MPLLPESNAPGYTQILGSSLFNLLVRLHSDYSSMVISFSKGMIYTSQYPHTLEVLRDYLPSIFSHKCFNKERNSFVKEVQNTELGHLFEHLVLEYLSIITFTQGDDTFMYRGVTSWNWKAEKRGVFHVTINIGIDKADLFFVSINKSIIVMEKILAENIFELMD